MAKIEKPQALEQIDDIIRLSDAVMVARGDLGVEIPHEDVPGRQKELIRACRLGGEAGRSSRRRCWTRWSRAPTPTRAEASDVATAIYDGADAVMLSAESATGRYPRRDGRDDGPHHPPRRRSTSSIARSSPPRGPARRRRRRMPIATATASLADAVGAAAIVAYTLSGTTAARVARKRPAVPILALTPDLADLAAPLPALGRAQRPVGRGELLRGDGGGRRQPRGGRGIRQAQRSRGRGGRHPLRRCRKHQQHPDRPGLTGLPISVQPRTGREPS